MDSHTTLCHSSNGQEDDWKALYENSFPVDERMAVQDIRQHLNRGTMLLHKTMNKANELLCFSLTFPLIGADSVLLSYIATDPTKRSGGFGSKHMRRLVELLKVQYPGHYGLFLEIESTKEPGLDLATLKSRQRRLDFYQRLGAKRLCKTYVWPSMIPGQPPRLAELLWIDFGGKLIDDPVLAKVILTIYEKAYNLKAADPMVQTVLAQFSGAVSGAPPTTCPAAVSPGTAAATTSGGTPANSLRDKTGTANPGCAADKPASSPAKPQGGKSGHK